jgi:hypothetical protein
MREAQVNIPYAGSSGYGANGVVLAGFSAGGAAMQ